MSGFARDAFRSGLRFVDPEHRRSNLVYLTKVLLQMRKRLLAVLLKLRVLGVSRCPAVFHDVFVVIADVAEDVGAIELGALFLLHFLKLGLLGRHEAIFNVGAGLLRHLTKLLLRLLVILNQLLRQLLDLLVLRSLFDELAELNFEVISRGGRLDEILFFLLRGALRHAVALAGAAGRVAVLGVGALAAGSGVSLLLLLLLCFGLSRHRCDAQRQAERGSCCDYFIDHFRFPCGFGMNEELELRRFR